MPLGGLPYGSDPLVDHILPVDEKIEFEPFLATFEEILLHNFYVKSNMVH